MDLDERIAVLAGTDTWHTPAAGDVPAIRMSDGPAGARGTDWTGPASASFPCGTALAASFDPDLVRAVGRALGREARAKSAHVLLGPTVNLHRTPVGGRNFECMSEDPVLTGQIAAAYIDGVQSEGVACCVKHLVGNDTEFARLVVSAEIPERVLRELYLVPFEAAVAAGVWSIMAAYNRLNGTFCSEHPWLLTEVLRDEWGFDGVVVSDWFGMHSTSAALRAGTDIEMPGPPRFRGDALRAAHAAGEVGDEHIDTAVARIRLLAERTGAADTGTDEHTPDDPETRAVIRRAAAAGSVLLKNDGAALPLPARSRVALIGPYAATGRVQGGGSAKVRPDRPSALLEALRARELVVDHAVGCHIHKSLPTLRGEFTAVLTDRHGNQVTEPRSRLELIFQQQRIEGLAGDFGATVTGTVTPEVGGIWQIGLRSVGEAVVRIDGHEVGRVAPGQRGGSFFGYGSDEVIGTVELTAGAPVEVAVEYPIPPPEGVRGVTVGGWPTGGPDLQAEAVELARSAEVSIVVVGTNDEWETESEDRATIALPGPQDELVAAVAAASERTVVIVNAGSPVAMPWLDEVDAVLDIWFPGGQLGAAVTDMLLGDVEPGGRLPVTFPRRLEHTPAFEHHPGDGVQAHYGEGLLIGYRWYDAQGVAPLFPFGHGLGYTTFELGEPTIAQRRDAAGELVGVDVDVEVANTGDRPGAEVVQVYVRPRVEHPEVEPILRFAGFTKVSAVPGHPATAHVALDRRAFAAWLDGGWTIAPGPYEVLVGRSSTDLLGGGTLHL